MHDDLCWGRGLPSDERAGDPLKPPSLFSGAGEALMNRLPAVGRLGASSREVEVLILLYYVEVFESASSALSLYGPSLLSKRTWIQRH